MFQKKSKTVDQHLPIIRNRTTHVFVENIEICMRGVYTNHFMESPLKNFLRANQKSSKTEKFSRKKKHLEQKKEL